MTQRRSARSSAGDPRGAVEAAQLLVDELDRVVWLPRRFLDDPEDSTRMVPTVGERVRVADRAGAGALMPGSTGAVNPSPTMAAVVERCMDHVFPAWRGGCGTSAGPPGRSGGGLTPAGRRGH